MENDNAVYGGTIDREGFCALYGQYKDKLYRYALYRLRDPEAAEDAVSDCVLAAWKDIGRLRSADAFGAWIFRILHNICAGYIRREIAARNNIERVYRASSSDAAGGLPVSSVELAEALQQLSDEERDIVLLAVVSGLNSNEISGLTGLKPGAVRSKLSRSLTKMRNFLS